MLSFSGTILMKSDYLSIITQNKKNTKSLQVPCSPLFIILKSYLPGKRVLPFTSHKWNLQASITVEAAFALPLFVFFSLAVLAPMEWMDTRRKVSAEAECFSEILCCYAYAEELLEQGRTGAEDEADLSIYTDTAGAIRLLSKVEPHLETVPIILAQIPDEAGDIRFEVVYREKLPFFDGLTGGMTIRIKVRRRCWTGLRGKLKKDKDEAEAESEPAGRQELVYVAQNMGCYHTYRDCPYIHHEYQQVDCEALKQIRNLDGGRYYPCEGCCEGEKTEGSVYVTEWGERYHTRTDCPLIRYYLRKIPRSSVGQLRECSVCAKRHPAGTETGEVHR